jgi:hypothetical protein
MSFLVLSNSSIKVKYACPSPESVSVTIRIISEYGPCATVARIWVDCKRLAQFLNWQILASSTYVSKVRRCPYQTLQHWKAWYPHLKLCIPFVRTTRRMALLWSWTTDMTLIWLFSVQYWGWILSCHFRDLGKHLLKAVIIYGRRAVGSELLSFLSYFFGRLLTRSFQSKRIFIFVFDSDVWIIRVVSMPASRLDQKLVVLGDKMTIETIGKGGRSWWTCLLCWWPPCWFTQAFCWWNLVVVFVETRCQREGDNSVTMMRGKENFVPQSVTLIKFWVSAHGPTAARRVHWPTAHTPQPPKQNYWFFIISITINTNSLKFWCFMKDYYWNKYALF